MDKRYRPKTGIEEVSHRQQVLANIAQHPEWPFYQVARYLRTELHLTLQEMAKLTRLAPQTIQKMEQEDSNPTLNSIQKLLRPFGLSFTIQMSQR